MSSNRPDQLNINGRSQQSLVASAQHPHHTAQLAGDLSFQQSMERPWLRQRSPPASPLRNTFPQSSIAMGQNSIERWQGQPARDHPWHGAIAVNPQRRPAQLSNPLSNGVNHQHADLTSTQAQGGGSDNR